MTRQFTRRAFLKTAGAASTALQAAQAPGLVCDGPQHSAQSRQ